MVRSYRSRRPRARNYDPAAALAPRAAGGVTASSAVPEDVTIVDPDNGAGTDYLSLADWEAGEQADLTASNVIAVAECRASSGTADNDLVYINGWTTDQARYPLVRPAAGQEHGGVWDASKYRLVETMSPAIEIAAEWCRVIGLQISGTAQTSHQGAWYDKLLVDASGASANKGIDDGTPADGLITNCIVYDSGGTGIEVTHATSSVANCTVVDSGGKGIRVLFQPDCVVRNCLSTGSATADYAADAGGSFAAATSHNASGDGTAPGSDSRTSQTFTFVDAAGDDFHLAAGDSGAKGHGVDLSSEGFSDDIDGDTRGATWDIGADQVTGV